MLSLTLAGAALLTACGAEEAAPAAPGAATVDGGTTAVRLGAIPIVDVAPVYLAQEQGIFAEHGLEVEAFLAQGGAAIVPAVMNGEAQFGFSNVTSLLQAEARGVPLGLVAPGAGPTGDPAADYALVMVAGDSAYRTAADLEGGRVGINTINNISDTVVRESVRQAGGDPSGIEFVEIPFPDMVAAVASGQVDAAFVVEPFATLGAAQGLRSVAAPYTETAEDLTVAGYFTSDRYAAENPDVVRRFTAAMAEANAYAQANPDAVREVLGSYTSIPPEVAAQLTLPDFQTEVNEDSVARLLELGEQDGIIEGDVEVSDVLTDVG
ncbi:ABC transporter substrate-binding protein [Geodermatophilus marinus]|uniref:ABC transporter substrate-binding protein n=1 Tax=Geodermatophilus sp. LHW52908 TaxID=2303986 RepID=UPI000E3DDA54|nr:ABC transporter substrate-binding protein [Geodermatophilus sp. LHW52908]RFU19927.1 nitrate ABC transporter substrate-binding protein [Geodermatophilus sp. LHW52908]